MFARRSRFLALLVAGLLGCSAQHSLKGPHPLPASALEAVGVSLEPAGIGSLEAHTRSGDTSQLSLQRVQIAARQLGDMAEVEATHTFQNDSSEVLEGTFRFPMPDGALLTGLSMSIDGKVMEGELVEREKARKAYESVVDSMQHPALLEWEHGSVFKMRVFPLEPQRSKVVTIRYLAPLRREAGGLRFVQAARADGRRGPLPALVIDWQGKRIFYEKNVAADRLVSVPAQAASPVLREEGADGSYSIVRLSPDWTRIPAPKRPVPQRWFVIVDTSRSALEELPRQLEGLSVILGALPASARFQVITSDLEAQASPQGLQSVSPAAIREAVEAVKRVTPDGASNLGRAFEVVAKLVQGAPDSALVYLGDCEPSWGVTRPSELAVLLQRELPHTPVYPLLFGASVDEELAAELAQVSGGRRARIRRREDLESFAKTLAHTVPTLDRLEVKAAAGNEVLASGPLSLEPDRELLIFVKAPVGRDPMLGLSVNAKLNGATLDLLPRSAPQETSGVARRYGAALVRQLEKDGKPAPEVVKASLSYGVMSKLTSFLVLESEQAYAHFAIERKRAQAADAPRVTGANLESADGTDISADRVQPGDPEILVDAERDALSVKVEFPFGETKLARFDPEARAGHGAWLVRFLVPRETAEGDYEALAHIQHFDGSLETKKVRYTVDNTPPELSVHLRPAARRPALTEVLVTEFERGQNSDLKRVELLTPQGKVYLLEAIRWGTFRAVVPGHELRAGTLRVVGFDQALNHAVKELALP